MPFLPEINFPRQPKLVLIQQTNDNTINLVGFHGYKKRTTANLSLDETTTPDGVREVVEEFRQSIDAPLKGKKK